MTEENICELKQIHKEIIQNIAQREKTKEDTKETWKAEGDAFITLDWNSRTELRERQKATVKETMIGNLRN